MGHQTTGDFVTACERGSLSQAAALAVCIIKCKQTIRTLQT